MPFGPCPVCRRPDVPLDEQCRLLPHETADPACAAGPKLHSHRWPLCRGASPPYEAPAAPPPEAPRGPPPGNEGPIECPACRAHVRLVGRRGGGTELAGHAVDVAPELEHPTLRSTHLLPGEVVCRGSGLPWGEPPAPAPRPPPPPRRPPPERPPAGELRIEYDDDPAAPPRPGRRS